MIHIHTHADTDTHTHTHTYTHTHTHTHTHFMCAGLYNDIVRHKDICPLLKQWRQFAKENKGADMSETKMREMPPELWHEMLEVLRRSTAALP